MPKPVPAPLDIRQPLREAAFLIEVSRPDILIEKQLPDTALMGMLDSRMLAQAFGNLIKNATEAIDGREPDRADEKGHVLVRAAKDGASIVIDIIDNGRGLPRENRQRLLEPYMTTREKGTGLGLAIVRKIVEEHAGTLSLHDAPPDFYSGAGANIRIVFPAIAPELVLTASISQNKDMTSMQESENGV